MRKKLDLNVLNDVLTNNGKIIANIKKNRKLDKYIIGFNSLILIFTLIYGATTGFFVGGYQVILNAVKIPLIILGMLYISLPVFYVFNFVIDKKLEFKKLTTILLAGFTVTTLILCAFSPLIVLFSISTADVNFIVLLNSSIGVMALFCGMVLIYQLFHKIYNKKRQHVSLIIGYFVMFLAGTQLIWIFRPYLHYIGTFAEPGKSNFYIEIARIAAVEVHLTAAFLVIFILLAAIFIFSLFFSEPDSEQSGSCQCTHEQAYYENRNIWIPPPQYYYPYWFYHYPQNQIEQNKIIESK
ncbi:MAG: hypothetical protein JSV49_07880 [Thermoplasmata archaeon]|nr:MAG: hypothetical protein JSV49_07880 [Thermoplasmata archaeon]